MSFGNFTLTGQFFGLDGVTPASGRVQIDGIPQVIVDTGSNKIRVGPRTVVLDAQGSFSTLLPSDSTTGNSTGIGFRVTPTLKHQNLAPVEFYARPIGATVDLKTITSQPVVALTPTGVSQADFDAYVAAHPAGSGGGTNTGIDVKSAPYNAKGDGTTDDTAAIHAARDAAALIGADLLFTPGTYITTGLTANKANQRWGLQRGATLKAKSGTTLSVITASAAGMTIAGPGTIDGNRANVSSGVAGVYSVAQTNDILVDGVTFQHLAGYGVELAGDRVRVKNCKFIDIGPHAILIGPLAAAIADCEVSGNYIDKSAEAVSTGFGAISIGGTTNFANSRPRVTNNHIQMPSAPTNGTGLPICIEVRSFCPGAVVSSNTTTGGSMGVSIDRSAGSVVSNNTIFGPNWYGVELAGSSDCVVIGNTIDGNGILGGGAAGTDATAAIVTDGASSNSDRAVITGNKVTNMVIGAGSCAILLSSGTGFTITGNFLKPAAHGIIFSQTTSAVINSNRIEGPNFAGSTAVLASNSSGRLNVTGNQFFGFDRGVSLRPSSVTTDNITVTGNSFTIVTTPDHRAATGTGAFGTVLRWSANLGADDFPVIGAGAQFVTGLFYGPQSGAASSAAVVAGSVSAFPFVVSKAAGLTITSVAVDVSTGAASSVARVGVYADSAGQPGALIQEFTSTTTLDTSTAGAKTVTGLSRHLDPGLYWVAVVAQGGAPTLSTTTGQSPYVGRTAGASGHSAAYSLTGITGALPATFGAPSGTNYAINATLKAG